MTKQNIDQNQLENLSNQENILLDSVKVLSDLTLRDIERSYKIEYAQSIEIYNING